MDGLDLITAVRDAIAHNDTETIERILKDNPYVWRESLAQLCITEHRANILVWVYERLPLPGDVGDRLLAVATSKGNYQIYKWAKTKGFEWRGDVPMRTRSVLGGNMDILKEEWYTNDDDRQNTCFTQWAAIENHTEVLVYLYEQGQALDATVCYHAISNRNLGMLRWAHEHGAEWDAEDYAKALQVDSPEIIEYLDAHNCPR